MKKLCEYCCTHPVINKDADRYDLKRYLCASCYERDDVRLYYKDIYGGMEKGEEKTLLEIIEEIAKGTIKTDLYLHYEYGLDYTFYINSFKLIADNGTGLYIHKVLNDKFKLIREIRKENESE